MAFTPRDRFEWRRSGRDSQARGLRHVIVMLRAGFAEETEDLDDRAKFISAIDAVLLDNKGELSQTTVLAAASLAS